MAASIWEDNMFSVRVLPWHNQGVVLKNAPSWDEIPNLINSNWKAEKVPAIQMLPEGVQRKFQVTDITTGEIIGYIRELKDVNEVRRDYDGQHFGFVGNGYSVLDHIELIELAKAMAGLGAIPETGGLLYDGRTIWIACKAETTVFAEEAIDQYFCLTNTHGGGGAIKAVVTPIRPVCANTLNAALRGAKRSWSYRHTTNVKSHIDEAVQALKYGNAYMDALGKEIDVMKRTKITEERARDILDEIVVEETRAKLAKIETLKKQTPFDKNERLKNLEKIANLQKDVVAVQDDLYARYFEAPDLQHMGHNQLRLWNAISDYATHTNLHKKTKGYNENLLMSIINDNSAGKAKLIDKGYKMAKAA